MKLSEMKEMVEIRKNLSGFLHHSDIREINKILAPHFHANAKSFNEICNKAFELYKNKGITNAACSKVVKICCSNNDEFRTESHRYMNGQIFEYDQSDNSYFFLKTGTRKEFNALNHYVD